MDVVVGVDDSMTAEESLGISVTDSSSLSASFAIQENSRPGSISWESALFLSCSGEDLDTSVADNDADWVLGTFFLISDSNSVHADLTSCNGKHMNHT